VTSPTPHRLTALEIGAILLIVVIWGANNAAAKVATEQLPPLFAAALRFGLASLCLLPFVRPPFPNWKSLLLIVLMGGPVHYGLIYLGFSLANDVSPASVATQLWIPFTALFAFLILGERLTLLALTGLVVAFLGIAWMAADPHALEDWQAIVIVVGASAAWALTTVVARRTTSIPPLKMQGLLALTCVPTLAAGSALWERGQFEAAAQATPLVWGTVLWSGLASSIVATTLMFWLVQRREAGRVTPYLLATPVVSILIGALWLGDVLTVQILTGAALTICGVGVVALAERGLRAGAAKA
jgi:O-acetylserine/cysteine efflux transporter